MKNLKIFLGPVLVFIALFCTLLASAQKNVIVFIGDGYGIAPKTAARMSLGQGQPGSVFSSDAKFQLMAVDKLKYVTMVTTHSNNSWITDSAPGATVYAAGKKGKVNNEAVAFDVINGVPVETILENAKKNGYAVGLVTTTRVTHATPADFASHSWNRDLEDIIAAQYLSKSQDEYAANFGAAYDSMGKHWVLPAPKVGVELDVILGGGSRHFLPKINKGNEIVRDSKGAVITITAGGTDTVRNIGKRSDNIDFVEIAKNRGYVYVNSRDALGNLDLTQFTATNNKKLIGLFNTSMMNYEQDRQLVAPWEPTLADMTDIAIKVLKAKSTKGFFLMVEGGRIDHIEHANGGGITYADDKKSIKLSYDKETFSPDVIYGDTVTKPYTGIYGSDFLIKEVLAFDYAVEKGRQLLSDNTAQTLIFSTSDHECGGTALVGLHDEADFQKNGTKIRTYAATPSQDAANGGGSNPRFAGVTPGAKWFPDYTMVDFQGYKWPQATATGRRIVISYGSNPLANGNGTNVGATPGNHTPADIWVGADDNVNGTWASKITGRGLMDNTDLTPIMKDFLGLTSFSTGLLDTKTDEPKLAVKVYPNPSSQTFNFDFNLPQTGVVSVEVYTISGQLIGIVNSGRLASGNQSVVWSGKDVSGAAIATGAYISAVKVDNNVVSVNKLIKE